MSKKDAFETKSNGSTYVAPRTDTAIPIEQYKLNVDPNPIVIKKKSNEKIKLIKTISLRFLKPPQPTQPGDITIIQEPDVRAPAAPPLVIRLQPDANSKSVPIIIRERPPATPVSIPPKNIVIPGKILTPPPRQVFKLYF